MFNVNLLLARRAWRYGQYGGLVVRRAVHMAQHQSASLLHASTRHSPPLHPHRKTGHMRSIFMWVENIFNRVDHARIRQVGPDRYAISAAAARVTDRCNQAALLMCQGVCGVCATDGWCDQARAVQACPSPRERERLDLQG
jgi:hypothetical protein